MNSVTDPTLPKMSLVACLHELSYALSELLKQRSAQRVDTPLSFASETRERHLSFESLVKGEWIVVDALLSAESLKLFVELQDHRLERILLWAQERKVPFSFDEHEEVYTFELTLPLGAVDCEVIFRDGTSQRFTLFSAESSPQGA